MVSYKTERFCRHWRKLENVFHTQCLDIKGSSKYPADFRAPNSSTPSKVSSAVKMQFTTFVLLSALVASAASVNAAHAASSAAVGLVVHRCLFLKHIFRLSSWPNCFLYQRRADDDVIASVWTDANQGGQQKNISANAPPLACMDFADPFQDSISSLSVNEGVLCTFFR